MQGFTRWRFGTASMGEDRVIPSWLDEVEMRGHSM